MLLRAAADCAGSAYRTARLGPSPPSLFKRATRRCANSIARAFPETLSDNVLRWDQGHRAEQDKRVRLYSRPGNDLTHRFPLVVEALARLRFRSCIIDGEAVACGDDGIALFDRIR
jgi:ATP-dependent DNA ligase